MANNLAKFYQKFTSGDDKFTLSTGQFFAIVFSFPDNALFTNMDGALGKIGNFAQKGMDAMDKYGLGGNSILQTGAALLSTEIGLNDNLIARFPTDEIQWLVKSINLPNLKIADGDIIGNSGTGSFSSFSLPGMGVVEPESDSFSLDFLPTVESPIEGFFIPWMEEVMSMETRGLGVPFRRANMFVHIFNENTNWDLLNADPTGLLDDLKIKYTYKLHGVYPSFCDTPNLSHESQMDNRSVGFKFNHMSVFGNPLATLGKGMLKDKFGGKFDAGRQLTDKVRRFVPTSGINI